MPDEATEQINVYWTQMPQKFRETINLFDNLLPVIVNITYALIMKYTADRDMCTSEPRH